jgi:hypothetical protein
MVRQLSTTAAHSATAEETDEVWLVLITISHADLDEPLRVVNNIEDIVSRGETYIACPFELEEPGDDPDGPTDARIKVDNVDRRIVDAHRLISSPPSVTLEAILASDPDELEYSIQGLILRDASWDATAVQGTLRFEDLTIEPVAEVMTPDRFPGLM